MNSIQVLSVPTTYCHLINWLWTHFRYWQSLHLTFTELPDYKLISDTGSSYNLLSLSKHFYFINLHWETVLMSWDFVTQCAQYIHNTAYKVKGDLHTYYSTSKHQILDLTIWFYKWHHKWYSIFISLTSHLSQKYTQISLWIPSNIIRIPLSSALLKLPFKSSQILPQTITIYILS